MGKGKKGKFIASILLLGLFFFLFIFLSKNPLWKYRSLLPKDFKLINKPLVIGKYEIPENWVVIKSNFYKINAPQDWVSHTVSEENFSLLGLVETEASGKDWDFVIGLENQDLSKTIKETAATISREKEIVVSYEPEIRRVIMPKYQGVLLGKGNLIIEENGRVHTIYFNSEKETHLKILSTLEILQ